MLVMPRAWSSCTRIFLKVLLSSTTITWKVEKSNPAAFEMYESDIESVAAEGDHGTVNVRFEEQGHEGLTPTASSPCHQK